MGDKKSWQKKFKDYLTELTILKAYDLQVKKIKAVRGGYKVKTDRGYKFLKKVAAREEELNFVHGVLEHLARQGFYKIARFLPTKYGDPYVREGDDFYYLTDWIEGKEANLKKPLVLEESLRALAQLHKASRGCPVRLETRNRVSNWPQIFGEALEELMEFRDYAGEKLFPTEFDRLFLDKVDYYYRQGQQALDTLTNSHYRELVEEDGDQGVLCHRDFVGRNLIRAKDGDIYIVDFDHCGFDLAMYDLSRFLSRYLPKHGWDQEVARFALNTYNSILEISQNDYQILRAFLEFPRKFHRLASQYYRQEKDWTEEDFLRKLTRFVRQEEARANFLATFTWS